MDKNKKFKKDVLRFALFIGELMLANGAETHRVEDTIRRICYSRGFRHINVFTSPTTLIISDERFDGLTFMKSIKSRSINLDRIVALNDYSRKFVSDKDITIDEAIKEIKELNNSPAIYSNNTIYLATGIACASFSFLVGGNTLLNFLLTVPVAVLSIITYNKIMVLGGIPAFSSLISSMFVAIISVLITALGLINSPKAMIIGSIMPLLPGVSFIKGVRDLVAGDLISGVARIFEACLTAIAIASGVGLVLELWFSIGGAL